VGELDTTRTHRSRMITGGRSVILLELPVDVRVIRIARLVAGGLAATAGFDVDEIDDLRIAVDEGCGVLFEIGDGSPVNLTYAIDEQQVEIVGRAPAHTPRFDPARFRLSEQILSAACDGHSWGVDHGVAYFRLHKSH
jgi:anti-sigma regulatory factor (Ser/Thr protein kinase)